MNWPPSNTPIRRMIDQHGTSEIFAKPVRVVEQKHHGENSVSIPHTTETICQTRNK
jgi:hypothetical protein